nr:MAG TPA: Structural protein [Caudoviricetes sp.]
MPIGKVDSVPGIVGNSYYKDPLTNYAQSFREFTKNILNESGLNLLEEPKKVLRNSATKQALREFFTQNFLDECSTDPFMNDPAYVQDQQLMMEQQFDNDVEAIYEHADMADYNPVIGLAFPIHKNILMNMVFDKGAIQKVVAEGPKFSISMETRILVDTEGNEIDMYLEQNKMTPAIDKSNPVHNIDLTLPEMGETDVLAQCGGTKLDSLSIKTYISAIMIEKCYIAEGDIKPDENNVIRPNGPIATADDVGEKTDVWFPVDIRFAPGYNQYERTFNTPIEMVVRKDATTNEVIKDTLAGTMDKNKFTVICGAGKVKKVRLSAELDTSNHMLDTCTVKWRVDTTLVEIPNAIPLSVTISPEEIKDLAALYQVDQLTKIMSLLKTTLANYKDDKILQFLENDYETMPERCRGYGEFDYAPPTGYALDPLTWRHSMFFDFFDTEVTRMLQVLNDPNMVVTIFGDPDLIRKITPVEYTYQAPSSIGPVDLDYTRTIKTSDKRVYQYIGSDKMRWRDDFIVLLTPRNSNRITYRIYDYQLYVSNEIRNAANPALPAVTCFERFKLQAYQAVQYRVKILNRNGMRPATTP